MTKSYTELMTASEYDVSAPSAPVVRYAIVGSPRSGSNLLSDLLYQMGLGVPMEYFSPPAMNRLSERWGAFGPMEYSGYLFANRTSENGVFGVKVVNQIEWMRASQVVWPTHVIRLVREDREQQAESLAKVMVSQRYIALKGDASELVGREPTPEELQYAAGEIEGSEAWYDQNLGQPSGLLSYEYLVKETETALRNIHTLLTDETLTDDWEPPRSRLMKQRHDGGVVNLKEVI